MTHRQKKKENWEKYIADQKVKYEKMQAGEIEPTEDEGGDQDGQSHGSTQSSDNAEPVADTPSEKLKPESDTNPADSSKNQEL